MNKSRMKLLMPRIIIIMLTWYVSLYYCGRIMDFERFMTTGIRIAPESMLDFIKLIHIHVVDDFFIHVIIVEKKDILFQKKNKKKKTTTTTTKKQKKPNNDNRETNCVVYNIKFPWSSQVLFRKTTKYENWLDLISKIKSQQLSRLIQINLADS